MKVLIVEDSVLMQERLVEYLSEIANIQVVGKAIDKESAIRLYRQCCPDVVLLDIRITGGSGFDVLEEIRRKDRSTIIIIFTDYPLAEYRKAGFEKGADYFFCKSKDFENLRKVLEKLGRKRIEQAPEINSEVKAVS